MGNEYEQMKLDTREELEREVDILAAKTIGQRLSDGCRSSQPGRNGSAGRR